MTYNDDVQPAELNDIVELFKLTIGQDIYFYTSSNQPVIFDSNTYLPKTIERTSFQISEKLQTKNVKLKAALEPETLSFLGVAAPYVATLQIIRIDKITLNSQFIFTGSLVSTQVKDKVVSLDFNSDTIIDKNTFPPMTYQSTCNNKLFDNTCGVDLSLFSIEAVITISGSVISSATFALESDGYYENGQVLATNGERRFVDKHVGTDLTLQIPFSAAILNGSTVTAFAGCDKLFTTCDTKFNNFRNATNTGFVGFPQIPTINPVINGIE